MSNLTTQISQRKRSVFWGFPSGANFPGTVNGRQPFLELALDISKAFIWGSRVHGSAARTVPLPKNWDVS